jgi:exopolyphosphatase/guanosine-5'-triphosphate,3'-diphosphate pyrophosphatase
MPRFAALDVGSNALRLRVIEADAPNAGLHQLPLLPRDGEVGSGWREIASLRAPVRLGSEVFISGKLTPGSIGQAIAALREFRTAMDAAKVDAYRATATSAVREASNGVTLIERARRETGIEIEAIEGVEEARLVQLAVMRRLAIHDKRALLIDVGGGSTELTLLDRGQSAFSISLQLGTVRLIETFLKGSGAVSLEQAHLVGEMVDRALAEAAPQLRSPLDVVIGTGGNIDTLAELCPGVLPIQAPGVAAIDVAAMRTLFAKLALLTPAERRDKHGLRPDRADTIIPACAILQRVAEVTSASVIVAPAVGLKDGILEELVDKHFHVWDTAREAQGVIDACLRLGRRYAFDEPHGVRVAGFAGTLFDDMQKVHGFGDRERLLLRAAAILHDIGDFVHYNGHHKHSYYLIQHSDIMGLPPSERAIVANIARYHRKSPPDPSHPNFRDLDKDARGKVRALAAILRIADALDREHRGKVDAVRGVVERTKGRLFLFLQGEGERELEEWTVRAKSELLRDVFDLDVVLAGALPPQDPPSSASVPGSSPPHAHAHGGGSAKGARGGS